MATRALSNRRIRKPHTTPCACSRPPAPVRVGLEAALRQAVPEQQQLGPLPPLAPAAARL